MGMTWEQFWEQDSSLVRDYREAYRIRQDEINQKAWLQGLYVYEALCLASPLFRAFSKSGTRAGEYPDKPHEFANGSRKRLTPEQENQRKMQAGLEYMRKMTERFNKSFYQRQKAKEGAELVNDPVDAGTVSSKEEAQKGATEDGGHTDA